MTSCGFLHSPLSPLPSINPSTKSVFDQLLTDAAAEPADGPALETLPPLPLGHPWLLGCTSPVLPAVAPKSTLVKDLCASKSSYGQEMDKSLVGYAIESIGEDNPSKLHLVLAAIFGAAVVACDQAQ
jgi:hypothetical protein